MQMRSLWSPVLVRTPILLGSGLLWSEPWAGLQHSWYTHTQTYAQHSWGHSLSTSGARLLPPQPDKSPQDTNTHTKKAPGPQHERGHFSNLHTVTSNVRELLLLYSHWIWTKGRKEEEMWRKKRGQNGGMRKEKEMGGRKGHLGPFIRETMINGLAFSWSVLPQCFFWASPDKRVFEREWTPQILLFV